MSLKRKMRRKALSAAEKEYKANREEGPCYIEECKFNGDFIIACSLCDFMVQHCTDHQEEGQKKAKRHIKFRHPIAFRRALKANKR